MSELMDLDWSAATRYPNAEEDWGPTAGRHAHDEDAALTPIFHALSRSGWRRRQHEPAAAAPRTAADPVDQFRRDPLTAPIPLQAAQTPVAPPVPITSRRRRAQPDTGRHHRVRSR